MTGSVGADRRVLEADGYAQSGMAVPRENRVGMGLGHDISCAYGGWLFGGVFGYLRRRVVVVAEAVLLAAEGAVDGGFGIIEAMTDGIDRA
jgi:hypothetical protein